MNKRIKEKMDMKKYIFGVDLGGTTVKLGLFTKEGVLLESWEIPTLKMDNGNKILPDIARSIERKLKAKNINKEDVSGVGIGVPGPVVNQSIIYGAVNLGWDVLNVEEILSEKLQLPVKVSNDANVAALGELWQGAGKGHKNIVAVTLGTGVGGGIIINGNILEGSKGAAGEIGHIHVEDNETEACTCNNKGCLEQYASATGITRLAKRKLLQSTKKSVLRGKEHISAKMVFDAVKEGDELAKEIAEQFGMYLGKALSAIAAVVNPEMFIIGGGVSNAGPVLFDYICPHFHKNVFSKCEDVTFALATLGNNAGICGAAGLFRDYEF